MHEYFDVPFFVCKCGLLFFNIAFLVIGILLYKSVSSGYGKTIKSISDDWSNNAVADVMQSGSGGCPVGYQAVSAKFYGTETICNNYGFYYRIGTCGKKESGYT
jgi:hypothetical protein